MPPERPEELPLNEADTASVRVPLEYFADQDAPEPSHTRQKPTVQPDRHFFGIKQDAPSSGFVFNDDYDKRFPDDPYCQETSAPNAKVWRVYVEEAAAYDANMVGRYRDGLDVMLVFAGLFSAVVTSFLVQASQNLRADYGEMTAILLHDLVFIQLAIADGASVVNITSPSANPAAPFVANRLDIMVNGFWVVSLSASLAVALAAVLVKQWLHHYMSLHSGTSRHRSHVRHFRFTGLECWHVRIIIGMLPIIMHLSLILFLSGLILFFVPLHASLAWAVGAITVILCTLYFVSNVLPICYPQCPYQTPLSDFLNYAYQATLFLWHTVRRPGGQFSRDFDYLPWDMHKMGGHRFQSAMDLEYRSVGKIYDKVSIDALDWLYNVSSNPVVERIVIMALGGLPASARQYAASIWHDALSMELTRWVILRELTQVEDGGMVLTCLPGSESTLERLLRSYLFLPTPSYSMDSNSRILNTGNVPLDLALAITPMRSPNPFEMRELFISSHGAAVHPLVWNELVTLAASNGVFRLNNPIVTAGAHARFITVMLPYVSPALPIATVSPVTLLQALEMPPLAVWDYLLQMPALMAFDVGPSLSPLIPLRVFFAAAKFALHHIAEGNSLPEVDIDSSSLASEVQSHWTLLDSVLSRLKSAWFYMHEPTLALRDELMQFMEQIVVLEAFQHLDNLDHIPSVPVHLLDGCMSSMLSICDAYAVWQPSYPPEAFHLTLLHIAMSRLLSSLDSLHIQHQMDYTSFRSTLESAGSLMGATLISGQHEAYHLFVQDKWMQGLGSLWITGWDTTAAVSCPTPGEKLIDRYVSGLASPSMAVSRQQFIDYLYEPENLAIAVCHIVFTAAAERLQSLIALNPTHSSWDRCRDLMESIRAWNRNPNREMTEFPGDDLLGSKVVQCSDRSLSLDELIRGRFTGEEAGEKLDMAMQILNESRTLKHG